MSNTTGAGKLPLTYKGRPLMRKDNVIYYGSMADKYIVMMKVLTTEPQGDLTLSKKIKVELQLTDPDISAASKVVKATERDGLYTALDLASIWLERAFSGK